MNADSFEILAIVLVPAAATYLLRVLPLILLRKRIKNPFLSALFKYMPFSLLSAMIIPGVFFSTVPAEGVPEVGHIFSATAGFTVALIMSLFGKSLSAVAVAACIAAFATALFF